MLEIGEVFSPLMSGSETENPYNIRSTKKFRCHFIKGRLGCYGDNPPDALRRDSSHPLMVSGESLILELVS